MQNLKNFLHSINYVQWFELKQNSNNLVDLCSESLRKYDKYKTAMDLMPDHIKFSEDFERNKANYNKAFESLRKFNQASPKKYLRQAAQERRAVCNLQKNRNFINANNKKT